VLAQICADGLGTDLERIRVIRSDRSHCAGHGCFRLARHGDDRRGGDDRRYKAAW
jgi:hypothetical protein